MLILDGAGTGVAVVFVAKGSVAVVFVAGDAVASEHAAQERVPAHSVSLESYMRASVLTKTVLHRI